MRKASTRCSYIGYDNSMSTRLRTWNQGVATTPSTTQPSPVEKAPPVEKPLEAGSWMKQPRTPEPSRHMDDQRRDPRAMQRRARDKARRHAISVCVSAEEEENLRAAAYEAGLNFSEWARTHLFAAAKKRIPSRSRKVEVEG